MEREVRIPAGDAVLEGTLSLPDEAAGMIIFAHGSGSGRFSPRNRFVASILQEGGFGTLLFDLLTREEDLDYGNRFDIPLLARRLQAATSWWRERPEGKERPVGFFGASTGAAAALVAAVETSVSAVVSRGGRPDLASESLLRVRCPVLLVVGGEDREVIHLNRIAYERLQCEKKLEIVPGATHLFEEPGTLEEAAKLALQWFTRILRRPLPS